ncbi:MAG: DUF4388 domain-containing protein [Candidatus Eisenbacteria bacterium]
MSRGHAGTTVASGAGPAAGDVFLQGRLDQTDLFEICQFLLMGAKTGVLEVDAAGQRGALYFDHGQIVNAVDDALADGEAAAYRIFSWIGGTFAFRNQPPPPLRTIHEGTESLILDIARFMDEHREERAQRGESGLDERPEQWSHTEGVRKRQEAGDQLRQLFETLRDERGGVAGGDDPLSRVWDLARRSGHDAVLLRPGEPALGLSGGRAHPMPDTISDDTVLMAIAALGASEGARQRRSVAGSFVVSLLREVDGEALFLQGENDVLDWQGAGLPADWLEELAGANRGLTWIGAPPAAGRSRTARALAEEMAARGRYTVLLGEGVQGAGGGALSVRQTDPEAVDADLRRALHEGASVVVIDLVRGIAPAAVAHAAARSLVFACEPTADLRALLSRAAHNSRARSLFVGALFVTLVGERGHYESLWLPDEARLGLDFARHPERILGLPEDPAAVCDAGPLDTSA